MNLQVSGSWISTVNLLYYNMEKNCGVEKSENVVSRKAHNLEVAGSSPASATIWVDCSEPMMDVMNLVTVIGSTP